MSSAPDLSGKIISVFTGRVEQRWDGRAPSAIGKQPTNAVLQLEENGFVEDNQADLKVHGGPEKAVHHYAAEHMKYWSEIFPNNAGQFVPGCFGENISTFGLNEQNLCLGDILTMGTALVQVCQGRQPCWKLNAHTGIAEMAAAFQRLGKTGWYYRVLQTGTVQTGNVMKLVERVAPTWPLERVISARFDNKLAPDLAEELSNSPVISENWREAFRKKKDKSFKEDTRDRLIG